MILGLSHISINSTRLSTIRLGYLSDGWNEKINIPHLYNHPHKKIFLNEYSSQHHLCLLSKKDFYDIELLQHGETEFKNNNVYHLNSQNIIQINCSAYEKSVDFWTEGMGFVNDDSTVLIRHSPIPHWSCKISLLKSNIEPISALDNFGLSCLAFYSSNIDSDVKNLEHRGLKMMCEPFNLEIMDKKMNISILKGPSAELIELIELERK